MRSNLQKTFGHFLLGVGLCVNPLARAYAQTPLEKMPDVFILVSFSMPAVSLQQWLLQAEKIGASVILRGLVDNSFQKTTKAIFDLTQNHAWGIQIDPVIFDRFNVQAVPTVVMADLCPSHVPNCTRDFDKVSGNVSLEAALQTIARGNTPRSQAAQIGVDVLQGKPV